MGFESTLAIHYKAICCLGLMKIYLDYTVHLYSCISPTSLIF